jgi:hypothetical protein
MIYSRKSFLRELDFTATFSFMVKYGTDVNTLAADTSGHLKIECLVALSFPLVGNPSDLFKIVKKDSGQAGMTH